jgi:dipeptidyl-peptidase-4
MSHVDGITGELMLVHGLLDENVHFRHTARLVDALNRAQKPHELLMLPNERHMPRDEPGRVYVERRMLDFFQRTLGGTA